ncbi:MAG: hypothetical protein SGI84_00625 [Gemmatimonadota bacterium]|nr:hypothetical protein [Gemmatimonadota bacterium]
MERSLPIASPRGWLVAAVAGVLILRYLAAHFGAFSEGDEIALAAGAAAIHQEMPTDLYRYGVQFGYYRLVLGLAGLLGGGVYLIPDLMVWLSVVAGTIIPIAGLLAFRGVLAPRERWLLLALLVANPLIWQSSQYGNTAIVSVALTAIAAALLSNRPGGKGEALAMALFGAAMVVRADAVLVSSGIFALLWWHHRSVWRALMPLIATGAGVGTAFGLALLLDPRMGDLVRQVTSHTDNPIFTRFPEFLLFAMSPIPLLLAAAGARDLQRERPALLAVLGAWVLPVAAFYFTSTTTPRYLLHTMLPLSVATAVGVWGSMARSGRRRQLSGALVGGAAFLHLFVGLSAFSPQIRRSWLVDATMPSHDGPVYTGALLYKTFRMGQSHPRQPGSLVRFRPSTESEKSLTMAFDSLATGRHRGARVVLFVAPGLSEITHFLAQAAGVQVQSFAPGLPFNRATRMELGGAELVLVGMSHLRRSPDDLPIRPGDEVWTLFTLREDADAALAAERPAGVVLRPLPDWPAATRLWRYRVETG